MDRHTLVTHKCAVAAVWQQTGGVGGEPAEEAFKNLGGQIRVLDLAVSIVGMLVVVAMVVDVVVLDRGVIGGGGGGNAGGPMSLQPCSEEWLRSELLAHILSCSISRRAGDLDSGNVCVISTCMM